MTSHADGCRQNSKSGVAWSLWLIMDELVKGCWQTVEDFVAYKWTRVVSRAEGLRYCESRQTRELLSAVN